MSAPLKLSLKPWSGPNRDAKEKEGVPFVRDSTPCQLLKEAAMLLEELRNTAIFRDYNKKIFGMALLREAAILIMGIHEIFDLPENKRKKVWEKRDTMDAIEAIVRLLNDAISRTTPKERGSIATIKFTTRESSITIPQLLFLQKGINHCAFTFLCLPIEMNTHLDILLHSTLEQRLKTVTELQLWRKVRLLDKKKQVLTTENKRLKLENEKKSKILDESKGTSSNKQHKSCRNRGRKSDSQSESGDDDVKSSSTAGESGYTELTSHSGRRPHPESEPDRSDQSWSHTAHVQLGVPAGGFYMSSVGNYYNNDIVIHSRTHNEHA